MTLMAREWPRIAAEIYADNEVQIPECWEDMSWHNDMCASFEFTTEHNEHGEPVGESFRIWIDYKAAADREMPDSMKRFAVHLYDGAMDFVSEVVSTDSWFEVMATIINHSREIATNLDWGSALQIKAENEYFLMIEHMLGRESESWEKFEAYRDGHATSEEMIKFADELFHKAQEGHGNERG